MSSCFGSGGGDTVPPSASAVHSCSDGGRDPFDSFIRRFLKVLKQYFVKCLPFFPQFWFKSFLVRLSLKMLDPFWLTLIDFSGCCITVSDNINFVQSWRLSLNITFRFKFEKNVTSFGLRFAHMSFPATFVSFPASWWAGSETRT